jgi:hypothetical protein
MDMPVWEDGSYFCIIDKYIQKLSQALRMITSKLLRSTIYQTLLITLTSIQYLLFIKSGLDAVKKITVYML